MSDTFQARVDGVLASLEVETPSLQRLRRIPMDLVALAVARDLRSEIGSATDDHIAAVLVDVLTRNHLVKSTTTRLG